MIRLTAGLRELAGVCFASVTRQRPRIATDLVAQQDDESPLRADGSALAAGSTSEPSQANAANLSTNSSSVAQRVATWMSCARRRRRSTPARIARGGARRTCVWVRLHEVEPAGAEMGSWHQRAQFNAGCRTGSRLTANRGGRRRPRPQGGGDVDPGRGLDLLAGGDQLARQVGQPGRRNRCRRRRPRPRPARSAGRPSASRPCS